MQTNQKIIIIIIKLHNKWSTNVLGIKQVSYQTINGCLQICVKWGLLHCESDVKDKSKRFKNIWKVGTVMPKWHSQANLRLFSAHPSVDRLLVHNPASTWIYNESRTILVGGIFTTATTKQCLWQAKYIHGHSPYTHSSLWGSLALLSFQHRAISLIYF